MEKIDLSGLNLPEKEQKILEAAIGVFSEKGFSAATTSEIAKNAGVAEGTIFRYFKTKKDIMRGILIQGIQLISGKLVMEPVERILLSSEDKDLRTILKELLYDRIKLVDTVFPIARVILTEVLLNEEVREAVYQNIITRAIKDFRIFHRKMAEKGLMRDDIEPEIIFRSILGNMAMFIAQRKLFGDKFKMDDLDKEFDKLIDIILYGLVNNPATPPKV
ncbi:MAG: TetR/AcrR family transcriptional regulator [Clostridia bacterium]|nr:TetR/AcrR family transcriptional regulator [Clostridia bacterium]